MVPLVTTCLVGVFPLFFNMPGGCGPNGYDMPGGCGPIVFQHAWWVWSHCFSTCLVSSGCGPLFMIGLVGVACTNLQCTAHPCYNNFMEDNYLTCAVFMSYVSDHGGLLV